MANTITTRTLSSFDGYRTCQVVALSDGTPVEVNQIVLNTVSLTGRIRIMEAWYGTTSSAVGGRLCFYDVVNENLTTAAIVQPGYNNYTSFGGIPQDLANSKAVVFQTKGMAASAEVSLIVKFQLW